MLGFTLEEKNEVMAFTEPTTEDIDSSTNSYNGTSSTEIAWVEQTIGGGLRIWQILFLAGGALLAIG